MKVLKHVKNSKHKFWNFFQNSTGNFFQNSTGTLVPVELRKELYTHSGSAFLTTFRAAFSSDQSEIT